RRRNLGTIDALLRLLYRNPRIASRLNLTSIAVINDFIRMDDRAIFIGMNDADLHIASGVRHSTFALHALRHDLNSLLKVLCGSSNKDCLPRHCQRGETGHEKQSGDGYMSHGFLPKSSHAPYSFGLIAGLATRPIISDSGTKTSAI